MMQRFLKGKDINDFFGISCRNHRGRTRLSFSPKELQSRSRYQDLLFNQHQERNFHQSHLIQTTPIPKWLKSLESNQNLTKEKLNKSKTNLKEEKLKERFKKDLRNEIVIYESNINDHDLNRSPNRTGLKLVSLIVISTYFAQQIRHNGAFPIWLECDSHWSDYQLQLLDSRIRVLISTSILTFTTYKSLKYFLTLSHTIRRISIPITSSMKSLNQIKLTPKTNLRVFPIGSIDLIWPFKLFFPFLLISPSQFYSLNHLINPNKSFNSNPLLLELNSVLSKRSLLGIKPIKSSLPFYLPLDGNWGSLNPFIDGNSIKSSLQDGFQSIQNSNGLNNIFHFDLRLPFRLNLKILVFKIHFYLKFLYSKCL
ncbi:hypothetical protein DFH28DRAFT_207550 [Melampsora americana]|nr:hypothetical protein DFH28DRAFT_207550 [Melampsora americana]